MSYCTEVSKSVCASAILYAVSIGRPRVYARIGNQEVEARNVRIEFDVLSNTLVISGEVVSGTAGVLEEICYFLYDPSGIVILEGKADIGRPVAPNYPYRFTVRVRVR